MYSHIAETNNSSLLRKHSRTFWLKESKLHVQVNFILAFNSGAYPNNTDFTVV